MVGAVIGDRTKRTKERNNWFMQIETVLEGTRFHMKRCKMFSPFQQPPSSSGNWRHHCSNRAGLDCFSSILSIIFGADGTTYVVGSHKKTTAAVREASSSSSFKHTLGKMM